MSVDIVRKNEVSSPNELVWTSDEVFRRISDQVSVRGLVENSIQTTVMLVKVESIETHLT